MKKVISFAAVLAMCFVLLTGCGSGDVKLNEVMDKINADFSPEITKTLTEAEELNAYYSINADDVKQFAAEINPDNNAPVEIVMVEAVDSDAADSVEQALTTRYNSIYSQYSSYTPEKLDMVKNCKVTKNGNFVTLIVADDADKMLDVYYEYVK